MSTNTNREIPGAWVDLEEATRLAALKRRDFDAMRQASERMDRMREENRKLFGVQEIGVSIIREMRGEPSE